MPRNHNRINQSSTKLLQSWRGNCDVQILIYDSPPDQCDLREISKVTDYVVAYSCKGNSTLREEIQTNKRMILAMEGTTGDASELKRVCKKIINKASSARLISKQEASVLLGNLDLTTCSEMIDVVSISNSLKLRVSGSDGQRKNLLSQYAKRAAIFENFSLHQFYSILRQQNQNNRSAIPHFTGLNGNPTYPVTEGYARHTLIVYKPWRIYPNQKSWKNDFEEFIWSKACPPAALLSYLRVMQRDSEGTAYVEPVAKNVDYRNNTISEEDKEALLLAGLGGEHNELAGELDFQHIHKGENFQWDKPARVRYIIITTYFSTLKKSN
jgi:hypothetical protein